MGKAGKWLKSFLTGKRDKEKKKENIKEKGKLLYTSANQNSSVAPEINIPASSTPLISIPPSTPKEKRRWSFRRSSASAMPIRDFNCTEQVGTTTPTASMEIALDDDEDEQKKHAMAVAVAVATPAAADAAVAAAQPAAAVIRLTTAASNEKATAADHQEAAAIKIQSVFRSYLARKALNALKGLVKLQALVRGHLVRKQATATLKCMQSLVTAQARARAQRMRMVEDTKPPAAASRRQQSPHRRSTEDHHRIRHAYNEIDKGLMGENIKIVEMDHGDSKKSNLKSRSHYPQAERVASLSPALSALSEMSPRASRGHFEECCFSAAQSSPQYHYSAIPKPDHPSKLPFAIFPRPEYAETVLSYDDDYPLFPNYMANTESSRAKVRSQSAPKSRPDNNNSFERQPSCRRRASVELGRNNHVPRAVVRMQRSPSQVGATTAQNYYQYYPWSSIKLDRSTVSLRDSECGSTSTLLTNANYCRSLVAYDHPQGDRY